LLGWPEPPRVVCNGAVVPAGAILVANSTCYQVPADRCYEDPSVECEDEAARRREANGAAAHREHIALAAILTVGVVLLLLLAL